MTATSTFTTADRQRFTQIKAELRRDLPRSHPCSEAVYRCAVLFKEVRDKGYHCLDGHEQAGEWMDKLYDVGERQAQKYDHAATLTPQEVRGKHQGIEVMGQIGQEKDPLVRQAMWDLAEIEHISAEALRAGRGKARPYLEKGRRRQGIAVLQNAARRAAQEEEREKAQRQRTPRTSAELGLEELARSGRRIDGMLAGKVPVSGQEVAAYLGAIDGLQDQGRLLRERFAALLHAPQSETSERPAQGPITAPLSPAEAVAPQAAPVIRRPAAPVLQTAAEVAPYRPLLSFFHEELPPELHHVVQTALCGVVCGDDPARRVRELWGGLRRCLPPGHPVKRHLRQVAARLRAGGMAGRLFALDLLLAARLPHLDEWLEGLAHAPLPPDLGEMVRCYLDLLGGGAGPDPGG